MQQHQKAAVESVLKDTKCNIKKLLHAHNKPTK